MRPVTWGACISVFCLGFAANPASAFLAGLELTGGQNVVVFATGTIGWEFNTNRDLQIDALGIFDSNSPGLNGTYTLGIWNSSRNLLASTTVSGSGDGISNGFVWKSLASVLNIAPGDYVVAAAGPYSNSDRYTVNGTYTTLPGVTWLRGRAKYDSPGLNYPTFILPSSSEPSIFGGNFSVAVPGPLPLAGATAAFGWSRRLRKRVKAAASES